MNKNIPISTINAKIARLNIKASSTKLFEELDISIKNIIQNNINLLINESLILSFYSDKNYWWVITNMRIVINEYEKIESYKFDCIQSIQAKDIFELGISNQDCIRLQLMLSNGNEKNLQLETNTWFSILNLLNFLTGN